MDPPSLWANLGSLRFWGMPFPKKEDMFVFSAKLLRHVQTSETFYRFTKWDYLLALKENLGKDGHYI